MFLLVPSKLKFWVKLTHCLTVNGNRYKIYYLWKVILSAPFLRNGPEDRPPCSGAAVILGSIPTWHFLPGTGSFWGCQAGGAVPQGDPAVSRVNAAASASPIVAFQTQPGTLMPSACPHHGCSHLLPPFGDGRANPIIPWGPCSSDWPLSQWKTFS